MTTLGAFFESYYRLRPVNATFTGVHDYDRALPDWSPQGLERGCDEMHALRRTLSEIPPVESTSRALPDLCDVVQRDRALASSFLDVQIAEYQSGHFQQRNPSLAVGEAVFSVIALMTRPFAPINARVESATARLSAIPRFLEGARASLTGEMPAEWRAKAVRECRGAERLLADGIAQWPTPEIDGTRLHALLEAAAVARAAFDDFRRWLGGEAKSASTEQYGCGTDLFDVLLARGHWCDRSRTDLLAEARNALDESLARLDERAREIAAGGWPEVQQRLSAAHPSIADYLSAYQHIWNECRARAEALDLVTWPCYPIRYVPIPRETRDAAPDLYYLFYRSPAPFDRLPVHEYVVTPIEQDLPKAEQERRLRAANTSVIKLNHVVHHGAIGHHVQNYYAYNGPSEIGRVAAVDCACRIGMFLGGTMAEGWACYATDLMDSAGFFTAEESLAQQHTRARLLARAVVDIGLHERSLTFDGACALYRERIGMTPEAAAAEACKNSMYPATAVMYWLGTEALHQLRRDRERIEGAGFSLGRFHDRLLGFGSIPVPLIARIWS